jgi:ribonuclease HII
MSPAWPATQRLAGVDEAGRGPLAGPVVAAAVILSRRLRIRGLDDSKALTADERERLAGRIRGRAVAWGLGWADHTEIDALNILEATMLAMRRALFSLPVTPEAVEIDGNRCPSLEGLRVPGGARAIVGGDRSQAAIAAASILAKTWRDAYMVAAAQRYPGYGFEGHKGYGTPAHLRALATLGASPIHRRSFEPVRSLSAPECVPCESPSR